MLIDENRLSRTTERIFAACEVPGGLNLERQKRLFDLILSNLMEEGDLTNHVFDAMLSADGSGQLRRYPMSTSLEAGRVAKDWKG
jgi:hypothetical protein